jgi:molybdopterin/thiamine biosynthesis adenylyltransferase
MAFTEEQIKRYSRHILLQGVGGAGQKKLLDSKVLIVGAGGLGSPIGFYLAAAGIGTLGIIDGDTVDLSNLQRQILHATADVDRPKVDSARETLEALNPDVRIVTYNERIGEHNILDLVSQYDFIVEGTDNFPSKFLVNDACVFAGKPFSQGGILRFQGQALTHAPGEACYRCVFLEAPPKGAVPSCAEAGVFGAVAGMLGTIQAAETIKYITGVGEPLINRLLFFDALDMKFREMEVKKNPNCPVCGENPTITEIKEYEQVECAIGDGNVARLAEEAATS